MSTIEERVRKIVIEQLGVKEDEVTLEASFVDDLGADSLDTVELVMLLEEEFDTEIPDDEAEKINTVQAAVDYVKANVEGAQSQSASPFGLYSRNSLEFRNKAAADHLMRLFYWANKKFM